MKTHLKTNPRIRPAAVAGRFYPANPAKLREQIRSFLADARHFDGPSPKALVAPHAGYLYSGAIAGSAFAQWMADRSLIRRIVLLGPSHRIALHGLAVTSADSFATPLGTVPVDTQAVHQILSLPDVSMIDEAHTLEHALEVEVPFLQVVLPQFSIVPIVVGEATPEAVATVIDALWGGDETRFVISSDLSHHLEWSAAGKLDRSTARVIEALDYERLGENQACGRVPLRGWLLAAKRHELTARTLDLRNSGDTAGSRNQVVGYGAFAFGREFK